MHYEIPGERHRLPDPGTPVYRVVMATKSMKYVGRKRQIVTTQLLVTRGLKQYFVRINDDTGRSTSCHSSSTKKRSEWMVGDHICMPDPKNLKFLYLNEEEVKKIPWQRVNCDPSDSTLLCT